MESTNQKYLQQFSLWLKKGICCEEIIFVWKTLIGSSYNKSMAV